MKNLEQQLEELNRENEALRRRLQEAEATLKAIQQGEIDALVIDRPDGNQVYSLRGVDHSYRVLIEEMQAGAITLTASGDILYANSFMEKMLNLPLEKIIGNSISQLVHPSELPVLQAVLKQLEQGLAVSTEIKLLTPGNPTLPAYFTASQILLEDMPVYCLAVTDLSEQKRQERILAEEQLSRSIISQSADAIIVCDETGRVIRSSQNAFDLVGRNFLNEHFDDAFHLVIDTETDPRSIARKESERFSVNHILTGNKFHSCKAFIEKHGQSTNHLLLNAAPLLDDSSQEVIGGIINLADITRIIALEKQLKENEEWLATTLRSIGDGVIATDRSGNVILMNSVAQELTGWPEPAAIGKPIEEIFHIVNEDTYLKVENPVGRVIQEGVILGLANHTLLINRMGQEITIDDSAAPIRDTNGQIIGVVLVFRDQTEERRTQKALRESRNRLVEAQRIARMGDFVFEVKTGKISWSETLYEMAQIDKNTEIKLPDINETLYHPEDREQIGRWLNDCLASGSDKLIPNEYRIIRRDGTVLHVRTSGVIQRIQGEAVKVFGTIQDVSERRQWEEQLLHIQKMDAIGTLAGGIAHDFNNILSVITGNLSYALSMIRPIDELFEVLSEVQQGAKNAQGLTQQLLTFSRGGEPVKKVEKLNPLIQEAATFVARGSQIRCDFDLQDDLWMAEIDRGQVNQVISNLVINSIQAMPDGGIVRLHTENALLNASSGVPLRPGRYAKITISDEGIGISEKHLGKIFTPFFTTKQKGNGLGLATAYSIISKHNGHISVTSKLDVGTTFSIYLPATLENVKSDGEKLATAHKGHGKILVMDDQEPILKMAGRILRVMGYEAVLATDGAEAIKLYRDAFEARTPFDLVILDLTVPGGMGGAKAIPELLKIDPKIKAIVSSGYSNDPIMANYADYGFSAVVPKPYTKAQLAEILNRLFGEQ